VKLTAHSTTRRVLRKLAAGAIERKALVDKARAIAGNEHSATVALLRLIEAGLVTLEYRITEEGARALKGAA
jgi:hypothetical protein